MATSKIYGDPKGPQIRFNRSTGALDVTSLILGSTSPSVAGTAVSATAAEINNSLSGNLATAAEINRACDVSTRIVDATASTLAVTLASHDSKTVTLNRAAGIAVTLPAAAGTGARFRFIVGTTVTSNSTTIKVANSSDTMVGMVSQAADSGNTVNTYEIGGTDDTITLNGTTTGGIKGDLIEIEDIANNLFYVRVTQSATGTEATPMSATV